MQKILAALSSTSQSPHEECERDDSADNSTEMLHQLAQAFGRNLEESEARDAWIANGRGQGSRWHWSSHGEIDHLSKGGNDEVVGARDREDGPFGGPDGSQRR